MSVPPQGVNQHLGDDKLYGVAKHGFSYAYSYFGLKNH